MAEPNTSPPPPEDDISDILARYREDEKPDDISDIISKYAGNAAPSWGDVPLSAVKNLPTSAYNFGHDLIQPFMDLPGTAKSVYAIGHGAMQKLGMASGEEDISAANAVGQFLVDRYGSVDAIKNTLATDPVGVASDLSMVLTGGAGAAARVPGVAGKITSAVGAAGRAIDPLSAAAKGIAATRVPEFIGKGAAHLVGDLGTHTGAESLNIAAKTGYEGGKAGEVFRENLRGIAPMEDVVEDSRRAVGAMGEARGQAYRSGMIDISKDRTILDFDKIDDALTRISRVATFGNKQISPSTQAVRAKISEIVRDWKADNPAYYHTPEGFDALKQSIGDILDTTEKGTREHRVASDVYNAVRSTIIDQSPMYAKVMSDYERASNIIREIDRTLTKPGASVDTSLRRLQSVLRNNVNTNYGYRAKLLDQLEAAGAPHLKAALAGQALSAVAPRGLGKIVASQAAATAAGHAALGAAGFGVGNLAALPLMSPRLMGEVAHNAGIAARWGKHVLLPHVPLRAGEQTTFQAGRSPETLKTYREGFARGGRTDKPSKAQTHYRLGSKNKRCEICTMFRAPHTCTAITGKVSKVGLCDLFERKRAYAEGGEVTDTDTDDPFERAAARVRARYADRRAPPPVAEPDTDGISEQVRSGINRALDIYGNELTAQVPSPLHGFGDKLAYGVMLPGRVMQGSGPAVTEEDQFRQDQLAKAADDWAIKTGTSMALDPLPGAVNLARGLPVGSTTAFGSGAGGAAAGARSPAAQLDALNALREKTVQQQTRSLIPPPLTARQKLARETSGLEESQILENDRVWHLAAELQKSRGIPFSQAFSAVASRVLGRPLTAEELTKTMLDASRAGIGGLAATALPMGALTQQDGARQARGGRAYAEGGADIGDDIGALKLAAARVRELRAGR